MKFIFTAVSILEIFSLLGLLFCIFIRKIKVTKTLIALVISVVFILTSYLMICYTGYLKKALVYSSVYFLIMDWILVFISIIILQLPYYSQKWKGFYKYFNVLVIFAFLDSFYLFTNIWTEKIVELIPVLQSNGKIYCWIFMFRGRYLIHMFFSYFLAMNFLVLSIIRVAKIPILFQKKYYALDALFSIVVIFNGLFVALRWPFNFSILAYPLVLCIFLYYILNTVPKEFSGILMEQVALNISTAVICYDLEGNCLFANNIARLLFRSQSEENKNLFLESYLLQWKGKLSDSENSIPIEDENFMINEGIHTFSGELTKLVDKKGRQIGYLIKLNDKTEYITNLQKEKYLASHDPLTGLYNRDAFLEECEQVIKENPDTQYVFVCTDIDNFKLVNDVFGEEIGNEILIGESRTLEQIDYEGCIHGRISGDKFIMLMKREYYNEEDIIHRFDVFQNNFSKNFHYRIRIFIGVYEVEDPTEDIQTMTDRGFVAIQKNNGDFVKAISYYDMSMVQELMTERTVLNDFNSALEHGEFVFYIQPQINAKTQMVNGGEALVRWNQPLRGILSPNNFVPILEKTDYIASLDYYIWEQVVRKLRDWKDSGYEDFYLSVNISAKDFYYLDVYESLTHLVEKYGINPKNLNLEVTETILMSNVEHHQKILTKLQNYGFKIEMDDFGSGYSSLSTLRNLVMDVLKIDMEFLHSTENHEQSLMVVNAIINMAKALNMTVITEGVELESQADALTVMGCDIFQGYYFSRPIPVSDFEQKYILNQKNKEGGKI